MANQPTPADEPSRRARKLADELHEIAGFWMEEEYQEAVRIIDRALARPVPCGDGPTDDGRPFGQPCHSAEPEPASSLGPSGECQAQGCDHRFVYSGLRWANGANSRPGSGAVNTYYGHAYFCERCLEPRVEAAGPQDRNSYQDRLPESTPATEKERVLLVPSYDQSWGRR